MTKNMHIPATELAMRAFDDPERDTHTIERVEDEGTGWTLTFNGGWCIWASPKVEGHIPQVGDTVTLWGRGIGYVVRGVAIDNVVYRYESDDDYQYRFRREQAERDAKRKAEYECNKPDHDRRIALLPAPLQERIATLRAKDPDFGWQSEDYELFCLEQGVMLAKALGTPEAVTAFYEMPWEAQRTTVPDLSDQHSGNTFGAACSCARWLLAEGHISSEAVS